MSATATEAIQDTMFGDPQQTDVGPESWCFCICGCATKEVKVSNSNLDWAGLASGK